MQQRIFLVLAYLAVQSASSSVSSLSAARLWLKAHATADGAPSGDELAELKGENPSAYALVKALLAKRSLGLLDPRHPNAKFAHRAVQEDSAEQGPEVFAKFASPGELQREEAAPAAKEVAVPYGEVQPAAHHDWLSWKPQQSAMDDETMVQNVLGAVAELKGNKAGLLSKRRSTDYNALSADEASVGMETEPSQPAKMTEKPSSPLEASFGMESEPLKSAEPADKPPAPKQETNPYIDFGVMTESSPVPAAKSAGKENSYLKGLDLMGDDTPEAFAAPAPQKTLKVKSIDPAPSDGNYLDSFSWNDAPVARPKPKPVVPQVSPKEASLLNWLGVVDKDAQPKEEAPKKAVNPYISDLLD